MRSSPKSGETEMHTLKSTTTILLKLWLTSKSARKGRGTDWWTEETEQRLPFDPVPRRLKPSKDVPTIHFGWRDLIYPIRDR
jgi:hypothetical protein